MEFEEVYEGCKEYIPSLSTVQKKAIQYAIGIISIFIAIILLLVFIYILQQVPHQQVAKFGINKPKRFS